MTELHKTDKKASEFDDQEPDLEIKLELHDPRKNHNKFWHVRVYGKYVVRHWGRHGTKGGSSVHRAWNSWGARNAAEDLAYQKRGKGYVKDETTILDRFAREVK